MPSPLTLRAPHTLLCQSIPITILRVTVGAILIWGDFLGVDTEENFSLKGDQEVWPVEGRMGGPGEVGWGLQRKEIRLER